MSDERFTHTLTFRVTDGPKWCSHFEITRDGDKVTITLIKRNGYATAEAEVASKDFFDLVDRVNPDRGTFYKKKDRK